MDDDDFEDLFDGGTLLEGSSQESLTDAAANLAFCDEENTLARHTSPASSVDSERDSLHEEDTVNIVPPVPGYGQRRVDEVELSRCALSPPVSTTDEPRSTEILASGACVVAKIERVFEQIADAMLSEEDEISVTLKRRTKPTTASGNQPGRTVSNKPGDTRLRRICYPGKSAEEAWRFTVVIRILELIHEALRKDATLSKRDIYYRDPALFGNQTHVDRYVDDIAHTFGVARSALNVSAVAKGLVTGAFTLCRRDGSTVNAAADRNGMLVPSLKEILSVDMTAVKWIVVIEKEASFHSIAASCFWDTLSWQGVLITGKGYPDIATRALLRYLSTPSPQNGFATPPVYGLVDFDPDGLAILSTYKHGSIALAHESAELRVPQLKWLGLRSEHMMLGDDSIHASQGLLMLTARDRGKARKMLERNLYEDGDGADGDCARELQIMLMLNTKAELQLLDAVPNGMRDLLEAKLTLP
ncbi:hypothetical protein LTR08_007361 [Meristemomyces frigidus]|nr:hypothetical protein LTR08_007361 [Meristemomyces frigidus]